MVGFDLQVDSVADLWVAVSNESDIEGEVVDARLAARSVVRSVGCG